MKFDYEKIAEYYDQDYWNTPGEKSGYINMTAAIGGQWHRQACAWFDLAIPVKGKKLFDAGCGLGHFMVAFEELGADVYGCDVSNYSNQLLQSRFPGKFLHTALENLDMVPRGTFDIVFCSATLEHVPHEIIEDIFLSLITITKPGGLIYIEIDTVPNEKRSIPEESHINIRSWGRWLMEFERPPYWWDHDFELEEKLREQRLFPGFPHPDWKFVVMRKIEREIQPAVI